MSGKVKLTDITGEPWTRPKNNIVEEDAVVMPLGKATTDERYIDNFSTKAAIGILCVLGVAAYNGFIAFVALIAAVAFTWDSLSVSLANGTYAMLMAALGFGMLKKSRLAAIAALIFYGLVSGLVLWAQIAGGAVSGVGLLISFTLLGGIWQGFEGISAYHRHHKEKNMQRVVS